MLREVIVIDRALYCLLMVEKNKKSVCFFPLCLEESALVLVYLVYKARFFVDYAAYLDKDLILVNRLGFLGLA